MWGLQYLNFHLHYTQILLCFPQRNLSTEAVLPYDLKAEASLHNTWVLWWAEGKLDFSVGSVNCLHPTSPGIHLSHCTGHQLLSSILIFQVFQDSSCCFPHVPLLLTAIVKHWHVLHSSFSLVVTLLASAAHTLSQTSLQLSRGADGVFCPQCVGIRMGKQSLLIRSILHMHRQWERPAVKLISSLQPFYLLGILTTSSNFIGQELRPYLTKQIGFLQVYFSWRQPERTPCLHWY